MPDIRSSIPGRKPSRSVASDGSPRPRADLVDAFARVLPGVVVTPATFRSETALAGQLRVDPRRIRDLRMARLVGPTRAGRGWVYGPGDIRTLSVMLALLRLGATVRELETFFDPDRRDCEVCGGRAAACSPVVCCRELLTRQERRMKEEVARLVALEDLVTTHAQEIGLVDVRQ
jgi:hypothetical protein